MVMTKTLSLRFKDKHAKFLLSQSKEVNFVWNFVNDLSYTHAKKTGKFFTAYDLNQYTTGATKEGLSLHSHLAFGHERLAVGIPVL